MHGDTDVMRRRAAQLREQGVDVRDGRAPGRPTEGIGWSGRAADSMRERIRERAARLREIATGHEAAAESAELWGPMFAQAESDIRAATTGKPGLPSRSIEIDADALISRATVLTYRWTDERQDAAYKTLGCIAGRAIGYLAPEVALGARSCRPA
jgi:hypothetical protein